jgi:citrate lyase subunit gamma (acyl carrier protein)
MDELKKIAAAGALEKGDARISVAPNPENRIEIILESPMKAQFGRAIKASAEEILRDLGVTAAVVTIVDQGAIDAVIRARLITAVCRSSEKSFDWKKEDRHAA